jgi:hypothetical protein
MRETELPGGVPCSADAAAAGLPKAIQLDHRQPANGMIRP